MQSTILKLIGIFLILFGTVTIFAGSSVLLDLFGMRERQGNYVTFVVAANIVCGFLYLLTALTLFRMNKHAYSLMALASTILILTFITFTIYIFSNGIYEVKTVKVLTLRLIITVGLMYWIGKLLSPNSIKLR